MAGENESNVHDQEQRGSQQERSSSQGGWLGAAAHAGMEFVRSVMRDGSLSALWREGMKDVQDTFHEAAWGQNVHGREPGAPLTPLHSDIENAREQYAPRADLPSPGDIARGTNFKDAERGQGYMQGQSASNEQERGVHGPAGDAREGVEVAQLGPWTQRELERRGSSSSSGGDEPFAARILPDEQGKQQNTPGRGR